jgi:predicted Fe-Mo cluster-binding NifX family protein
MRLALATWNGRISPVFDVARQVHLVEIEAGRVAERHDATLPGTDPLTQAESLAATGAEVLICGAVSQPMSESLAAMGIRLHPFTAGDVEQVLTAWLQGALPNATWSMPGCRGRMRRCHGGTGRRRQARCAAGDGGQQTDAGGVRT